jgi:hypothetical protein
VGRDETVMLPMRVAAFNYTKWKKGRYTGFAAEALKLGGLPL